MKEVLASLDQLMTDYPFAKAMPVLSVDHTSGLEGRYFHYDVARLRTLLGTNWTEGTQELQVINRLTQEMRSAIFWKSKRVCG